MDAENLRMRTPRWVEFIMLLVCLLTVQAIRQVPLAYDDIRMLEAGDAHFAAHEHLYAYTQYASLLARYPGNLHLAAQTVDAAVNAQWFGDAYGVLVDHLVDRDLPDDVYHKVNPNAQLLFRFADTHVAITEGLGSIDQDGEDMDSEEIRQQYIALLNKLLKEPETEKAMLYYNLATVQEDRGEYERYLRLASEAEPRVTYPLALLGNARRTAGHIDEARDIYAKALALNALDAGAMRGQAILLLLEGQKEEALSLVRRAYSLDPLMQWMPEALCVALLENGLHDEAETIRQIAKESGYTFDYDGKHAQYARGEITVSQIYLELEQEVESL
ncbi:MAG: hypothetical protein FWD25_02605 [Clostridia bacterium]|nr:hypothetical protein [Clostridia bacterium]